jgi:hypothetical protein
MYVLISCLQGYKVLTTWLRSVRMDVMTQVLAVLCLPLLAMLPPSF